MLVNKKFFVVDTLILFGIMVYSLVAKNQAPYLQVTGVLIIMVSLYLCLKVHKNKLLLLLFGIISFVNISLAYTDCIMLGIGVSEWQSVGLRSQPINYTVAVSLLLFTAVLNMMISDEVINTKSLEEEICNCRKQNNIIVFGGLIVLFLILGYGLLTTRNTVGNYVSVSSPLYEYSLIVLCFVWYYSKNIKLADYLIWIYATVFSIHFLLIGDRSSVFMLAVLITICYFYKMINLKYLSIALLVGIPFVNMIAIIRVNGFINPSELISQLLIKGFYVDTVSWAYYGSLSIASLFSRLPNHLYIFYSFFLGCLGFENQYYNLSLYAKDNYSDLYSLGGGIYPSYFYAMGGYIGVLIGAIILGLIIRKIVKSKKIQMMPYKILLLVYVFRWYLYSAQTLFRGVLLFTTIVYVVTEYIDLSTKRKSF